MWGGVVQEILYGHCMGVPKKTHVLKSHPLKITRLNGKNKIGHRILKPILFS